MYRAIRRDTGREYVCAGVYFDDGSDICRPILDYIVDRGEVFHCAHFPPLFFFYAPSRDEEMQEVFPACRLRASNDVFEWACAETSP